MNRSETISKISAALLKAQQSMGNAVKGASNPYFKSSFADLNSIREAVTPALNANGITVLQPTTSVDGKYFVETLLLHESGEYISSLTEIIVAKANDPQAAGSAISYSRRYGLQSFLSVGAVDDDSEAAMGRAKSSSAKSTTFVTQASAGHASNITTVIAALSTPTQAEFKPSASFTKPTPKAATTPKAAEPVKSNGADKTQSWD